MPKLRSGGSWREPLPEPPIQGALELQGQPPRRFVVLVLVEVVGEPRLVVEEALEWVPELVPVLVLWRAWATAPGWRQ
jgi:hypothetical protein